MPQTPTDPTKAQVWVTGEAPNQQLEFYIPRGAKGEPGGYTAGTPLLSNNLNDIKVPGIYKQDNGSLVTLLLNYPVTSSGILHVDERVSGASGSVMQTYYPFMGTSGINPRQFYKRYMVSGSTWGPWEIYVSTRLDQTAGRAIYTWDHINFRDQLVYGDTGERVVTCLNGGSAQLRRINRTVHFTFAEPFTTTSMLDSLAVYIFPAGFRPVKVDRGIYQVGGVTNLQLVNALITDSSATIRQVPANTTNTAYGSLTFITNDNWPTTLPGTASGSIPNL